MDIYPTRKCFDDAIELIEEMVLANGADKQYILKNFLIVHSICLMPDGRPYAHAWTEDSIKDQCIFRGIINGEKMYLAAARTEYYENFQVQETTKYTIKQACLNNLKTYSYGPWEEKYKLLTSNQK